MPTEGTVYNTAMSQPLGRAKVVVRETGQEALTDDDGRYVFRQVPAKTLQVDVSYLGFEPQGRAISVPPGGVAAEPFRLTRERAAKSIVETSRARASARRAAGLLYAEDRR